MPHKDPEVRKAYYRAYSQSPAGKKRSLISSWKQRGLIHDDYNSLYEQYLEATNCEACKSVFKNSFDKCLDHCHKTGKFRQFLCRDCNIQDRWLNKQTAYLTVN